MYLLFLFKKFDDWADQYMEEKNLFSALDLAYYSNPGKYLE